MKKLIVKKIMLNMIVKQISKSELQRTAEFAVKQTVKLIANNFGVTEMLMNIIR